MIDVGTYSLVFLVGMIVGLLVSDFFQWAFPKKGKK